MEQSARRAGAVAVAAATLALAHAAVPRQAEAQGGFFVDLAAGGGIEIDNWPTQLRVEEDFGWHFTKRPRGFFIALAFSQSFLNGAYLFTFAPRWGFDIVVLRSRKVDLVLTPSGTVPGFAVGGYTAPGNDPLPFFHMSYDFDIKLLFGRGVFGIFFRPVGFEIGIRDYAFVRYDPMFGLVFNP